MDASALGKTLEDLYRVVLFIGQPFIIYFLTRLISSIDKLTEQVRLQNGRVTRLETWRETHESWALRESERLRDDLDNINGHNGSR